jgi:hypothetical protein
VETDAALVRRARAAVAAAALGERVTIERADAAVAPIDDADVVVAFLPVATMEQLLSSILGRMCRGARLVAHEQERLHLPTPARSTALFSAEGITVAHRWDAT